LIVLGVTSECHTGNKPKKNKKDSSDVSSQLLVMQDFCGSTDRVPTLTPQQLNVVEMLQANENRYQWPSAADVERLTVSFLRT